MKNKKMWVWIILVVVILAIILFILLNNKKNVGLDYFSGCYISYYFIYFT